VVGPLEGLVWPALTARPDVGVMVMATNMSIGMGAWMRFRGHSWRGIAEMSASMYLPFVVLLVPFWLGAIGEHTLMTWGHLLMLPAMALVMLLRRRVRPLTAHHGPCSLGSRARSLRVGRQLPAGRARTWMRSPWGP
jgi:hypothetical protein